MYTLKKSLGQHFLHDEQMCLKIVDQLDYSVPMQLLEIGPGGGAISKYLIQKPAITYQAIEIDAEKVDYLNMTYPEIAGKIITVDILKADKPFDTPFNVIGNFPYNISSPILFKILEWEPDVNEVIGMFQKEVAERIVAGPGSKVYGVLSVLIQAHYSGKLLFGVDKSCFTPPPKVQSAVIRLQRKEGEVWTCSEASFRRVVKHAFGQRRKMLRNSLKPLLSDTAILTEPFFEQRPEQLSLEAYKSLATTLEPLFLERGTP